MMGCMIGDWRGRAWRESEVENGSWKKGEKRKNSFGLVVTGALESYAVADAHDGVINGIRMAGHVKTCRGWDQLFKDGNLHMVQRIQCYSTASPLLLLSLSLEDLKIFRFY